MNRLSQHSPSRRPPADPLRRHGRAIVALLVALAGLCLVGGVVAGVLLGGGPQAVPAPAAPPAPVVAGGGGFNGAATSPEPVRYAWLDREQADIVALSQGQTTASAPGNSGVTPPDPGTTTSPPAGGTETVGPSGPTTPTTEEPPTVPKVVGKSLEQAEQLLAAADLAMSLKARKHSSTPVGRVASQWPAAGSVVPDDGTVYVTKSLGPAPKKKTVRRSSPTRRRSGGGCSGDCSRCHSNR